MDSTLCKIYWILDLVTEIGLFYGGEHLEAKISGSVQGINEEI